MPEIAEHTEETTETTALSVSVGDLVTYDTCYGTMVGRVQDMATGATPQGTYLTLYEASFTCYLGTGTLDQITGILTEEATEDEEEKSPSLHERREELLNILSKIGSGAAYELLYPLRRHIRNETWFWCYVACSLDCPRHISYPIRPEDVVNNKRRKHCSIKKFLEGPAKKYGGLDEYTPAQIEQIAMLFGEKVAASWEQDVRILRGSGIVDAYAVGPQSCMKGKTYVRWYEENPEHCALLCVMDGEKCLARSVAWTTDCGATSIFSVYSDDRRATKAIEDKAKALGWGIHSVPCDSTVTMRPSSDGRYPYLDAFRNTGDNPRTATTIILGKGDSFTFSSQHGGWAGEEESEEEENEPYAFCSACDRELDEDETYYSGGGYGPYCEECFSERYVCLSYRLPCGAHVEGEFSRDETRDCDCCGEDRRTEDFEEDSAGNTLCLLCMEDHTICNECGELISYDAHVEVEDKNYCVPCSVVKLDTIEKAEKADDTKEGEETSCECDNLCPAGKMPGQLSLGSLQYVRGPIPGFDPTPLILWTPLV